MQIQGLQVTLLVTPLLPLPTLPGLPWPEVASDEHLNRRTFGQCHRNTEVELGMRMAAVFVPMKVCPLFPQNHLAGRVEDGQIYVSSIAGCQGGRRAIDDGLVAIVPYTY